MEALSAWALARLLPAYTGADSKNLARSLRRRFAAVGLLLGVTIVLTLWDRTANAVLTVAVGVVIAAGLFFYSERAHRPA